MRRRGLLRGAAGTGLAFLALCASLAPGTADAQDEHSGGTVRLTASSAGGTIDPHINYNLQYWQVYPIIYDGLVAFRKAGGQDGYAIVPDLAEALPEVTNEGKTYTFRLRKGIKFSTGQEVTVDDVLASFRRIFKVSGPTSGTFYAGIVGADACLQAPADCTLDGGISADAATNTVTINLTQPDSELLFKLAVPHAAILPADTPASDSGTTPIPGTGAYMITTYDPNVKMEIVRNPQFQQWSEEAQPTGYPDGFVYEFGQTPEAQVTAIQQGNADWMYDQPPTDRLAEIGTTYQSQVHINPLGAMWYAPMNTNLAPFDDVRVRQAVSYAIDRQAIVNLFGGPNLAAPVCQVLPPNFPGHVDYCPYTMEPGATWSAPDLEKAKQLVAESGTAGQEVTIVVEDTPVSRDIGTYLQSVLTELGYKAGMSAISPNIHFTYIQNTNNNVQISVSYWYQDFPAASNFLNVMFSCSSFHPGSDASVNISGFCSEELDAKMQAAMALGSTDPEAASAAWAAIDHEVVDQAPIAPLFTPKRIDFVSQRLGNFVFSPQLYWRMSLAWVQ